MTVSVLVATPHQAFGELLRLSLEEEGRFRARLVHSAHEAAGTLSAPDYQIAILDGDLPDMSLSELVSQLKSGLPSLKLILIPPENDPKHPALAGVAYHGYLLRPFYQPDLMALMENLVNGNHKSSAAGLPDWLNARLFDAELALTNARGGLLVTQTGASLPSGDLPETTALELQAAAERALTGSERTDLVRFVRLPGQSKDHLFYITLVADDLALALTYTVGTPLSKVRLQAAQIVAALGAQAQDARPSRSSRPIVSSPESAKKIATQPASVPADEAGDAKAGETDLMGIEEEEEPEVAEIDLAALLGPVPPPDPGKSEPAGWVPEVSMSLPRTPDESLESWDVANAPSAGTDTSQEEALFPWDLPEEEESGQAGGGRAQPAPARDQKDAARAWADVLGALPPADEDATRPVTYTAGSWPAATGAADETVPVQVAPPGEAPARAQATVDQVESVDGVLQKRFLRLDEPPVDDQEDTRPHVLTNLTSIQQIEPASPAFSQLSYTCVLIPRLPQHHLTGLLSDQLSQWVQQLCLAFGWRLEGIAIRPDYLQWTVQVTPQIAPSNLVRIIRQRASESIFQAFPALAIANPSGDFWATGYLIVGGPQPPSPRLLRDYIAETRRRQGVTPTGESVALVTGNRSTLSPGGENRPSR